MKKIDELSEIIDKLLSPQGCPWDREQTLHTLRMGFLEELYEYIEAVEEGDNEQIADELGDVFVNALFCCKLAEKEQRFHTDEMLNKAIEKLVRRHPHVFGDKKVEGMDQLIAQWEAIKKTEKSHEKRKSQIDGIAKSLPSLLRAHKVIHKMMKAGYPLMEGEAAWKGEEEFGEFLFQNLVEAQQSGIDAEHSLRKVLVKKEKEFRDWEEIK